MQKRLRLSALMLLLGLMLLLLPTAASAKSYTISRALLEAQLQPDGSLTVTETRTFEFDGAFSHVYQIIRMPARSSLVEIGMADEHGPMQLADTHEPGTFTTAQEGTDWRVDGYFQAENTSRTFTVTYRIDNAVRMHADGAELYWNLIGEEWAVPTALAEITVHLPGQPLDAWVEGFRDAELYSGQQIQFARRDLPAEEAMTLRVLLPREAVSQSTLPPDGETVRSIRAKAGRVTSPGSIAVQAVWLLAAAAGGTWFYRKWVKRDAAAAAPPGALAPLSPAEVAHFTGKDALYGFRATLLELVRRGVVTVEEDAGGVWVFTWQDAPAVTPQEAGALELLFPEGRRTATTAEWQGGANRDRRARLDAWWATVGAQLPAEWRVRHKWHMYGLALAGVLVALLTYPSPLRILSWIAAAALVVLGFAQRSLSDEGYRQLAGWEAVRKQWRKRIDYGSMPVAVALGVSVNSPKDPTEEMDDDLDLDWMDDTFSVLNLYWAAPASSDRSDSSSGGGGGDGGGGGGAE